MALFRTGGGGRGGFGPGGKIGGGGGGRRLRLKSREQVLEESAKAELQRGVSTKGLSERAKKKIKTIKEFTKSGRLSFRESKDLVEKAKRLKD